VPLYEYVCKKCKHRFEKIQKFSDRLIRKCPECGGPVERPLSAPAVHFKGSGFYVNDYNARKGGDSDGDSGGTTREKREKEEKKQEARTKATKRKNPRRKATKRKNPKISPKSRLPKSPPKKIKTKNQPRMPRIIRIKELVLIRVDSRSFAAKKPLPIMP